MSPSSTLWPLEDHTRGKHLVLRSYLNAWLPIMGTWNSRILFIDGFAGPGEYSNGEDGSPLIALRAFSEHNSQHLIKSEVVFIFIERNQERVKHLSATIKKRNLKLPPNCRVDVICGMFDDTLTIVLDQLDIQRKLLAPAFVMVDPFGVSGAPMYVIERILQNPQSEVYVSFMYESINRFKTEREFEEPLDQLFGCKEWRRGIDIEDSVRRKEFFYKLYRKQLKKAGAQYVINFELYSQKRLIYSIFFGTQHIKGCDRMKSAIWKIAPSGEFAFFGSKRPGQLKLDLSNPSFDQLENLLKNKFRDKGWVTIEEIIEYVASDATDYYSGQVKRNALKLLEKNREIEVKSQRKKQFTYPPKTLIRFV